MALFAEGKLFKIAGTGSGGGGGGDQHNLGWYATQAALEEAHPTAAAGDWAIVGATDTVWVWDTDNSEWVDSDQKGQVTSVNGQTGDVVLDLLPTQTGNAGKFLTTDGTNASWSDKPLVNQSTSTNELAIGNNVTPNNYRGVRVGSAITGGAWSSAGVFIGNNINTGEYKRGVFIIPNDDSAYVPTGDVVIGEYAGHGSNIYGGGISIGKFAKTSTGANAIAIGYIAQTSAKHAIQIGTTGSATTNSDANTFKVANENGNFEIMSADGTVPTARLTKVNTTATLAAADWSSNTQIVNVTGMTADGVVFVNPTPANQSAYTDAGILCTAQAAGSLTFTCDTVPSADITVTVVML